MATKPLFYRQYTSLNLARTLGQDVSFLSTVKPTTVDPQNAGTGYAVNDVLNVWPTGSWLWPALVRVTSIVQTVNPATGGLFLTGPIATCVIQHFGNSSWHGAILTINKPTPAEYNSQGSVPVSPFTNSLGKVLSQGTGAMLLLNWVDGALPETVRYARVQAEAADVRYRLDGTINGPPTNQVGSVLKCDLPESWQGSGSQASGGAGGTPAAISPELELSGGELVNAMFIGASNSILNVEFLVN